MFSLKNKKPVDTDDSVTLYFLNREESKDAERSIFLDEKNNIVMKGLPHPHEYVETIPNINFRDVRVYASIEGTSIHVFYHKDRWYTSTHKKLDAFKSYWADNANRFGASFARGLMGVLYRDIEKECDTDEAKVFMTEVYNKYFNKDGDLPEPMPAIPDQNIATKCDAEELKTFLTIVYNKYLHKAFKYTFILPPIPSERVGVKHSDMWPHPYNVMVRDHDFVVLEDWPTFPNMIYPIINTSLSRTDFMKKVINSNPDYLQGLYMRFYANPLQIKVYNKMYNERMEIRANTASLRLRYMFLRSCPRQRAFFLDTYPEFDSSIIENELIHACKDVEALQKDECDSVPKFDIKDVCDILERRKEACTFQNLMNLSYTAPLKFNKLLKNRKRAISKLRETKETMDNDELLAKMDVLDQFV